MADIPDVVFANLGKSLRATQAEADDPEHRKIAANHLDRLSKLVAIGAATTADGATAQLMQTHSERAVHFQILRNYAKTLEATYETIMLYAGLSGVSALFVELPDKSHSTPDILLPPPK